MKLSPTNGKISNINDNKSVKEENCCYLYDIDAHGCERQAEHQVYYRTHHVYGMLNQSINPLNSANRRSRSIYIISSTALFH